MKLEDYFFPNDFIWIWKNAYIKTQPDDDIGANKNNEIDILGDFC